MKRFFTPNGGIPVEVSSLDDIKTLLGDQFDGFSNIEIDRNLVLAYLNGDPSPICIGHIE